MSKNKKPAGITWGEASDELKAKVKLVLQMAQNNRYSVSRIYAAHNAIFGLKETPETCSTCLTSREKSLRKWWAENAVEEAQDAHQPINTDSVNHDENAKPADAAKVKTTGEKQTPAADDQDQADGAALEAFYAGHEAKLAELGVTADSSDEDLLEALEVLAGTEGNTEEDQQHYDAQVAIVRERIEAANVVEFVPASEGALYGNGYKGGQPLPEGVYEHEGKRYQVSGDLGGYTELAEDETGHDPKAPQTHFFGEGEMSMTFTPNADDVTKGVVAWSDGSKVKAGTYTSATGVNIAVQVGSKASIK